MSSRPRFRIVVAIVVVAWLTLSSCVKSRDAAHVGNGNSGTGDGPSLAWVKLEPATVPVALEAPISLSAAENEAVSFILQLSQLPSRHAKKTYTLRLQTLTSPQSAGSIGPASYAAYQVLPLPVDLNRAGYVRHTGLGGGRTSLPRALLPVAMNDGAVELSNLRDPAQPSNPAARADAGSGSGAPLLLWIDLHVPADAPPGDYSANC